MGHDALAQDAWVLAEAIPQQVWTAGSDGALEHVNRRLVDYLGRPLEEIVASGWDDAVHPEDRPTCLAHWQRALASGEPYEIEFRLRAVDGSYRWHLGRALPVRSDSGRITRWFGTNTDIDEQKRGAMENARLYREAEEAVTTREDLLTIVSQDLRQPVTTLLNDAGVLLRALPETAQSERQQLEGIRQAAERMHAIVHTVLDLEQIRGGSMPLDKTAEDPSALVLEAFELQRTAAASKGVMFQRDTPPRRSVLCDRTRILQVLGKLLANAIRNAPPGGRLTVSVTANDQGTVFSVSDSGPPIPSTEIPLVFDRRWRRGGEREATGLGLALARAIAEAHEGRLWVDTTDQATTFCLLLPPEPASPSLPPS